MIEPMIEPMTDAEIAEAQALADAATEGPWHLDEFEWKITAAQAEANGKFMAFARTYVPRLIATIKDERRRAQTVAVGDGGVGHGASSLVLTSLPAEDGHKPGPSPAPLNAKLVAATKHHGPEGRCEVCKDCNCAISEIAERAEKAEARVAELEAKKPRFVGPSPQP